MDAKEIIASVFSVAIKIVLAVVVVMFIYKYALIAYDYGYRVFTETPMSSGEGREVKVTVSNGMGTREIGVMLEERGLIRDANLFFIQEKLSENAGNIKPGFYNLNTNMTVDEMIDVMSGAVTITDIEETTELDSMQEGDEDFLGTDSQLSDDDFGFDEEALPVEEAPEEDVQ